MNETTNKVTQFTRLYNMNGLFYVSDFFTRITQESQTKIDVVLTNDKKRVNCQPIPDEKITDHETIKIDVIQEKKRKFEERKMVISWKSYNKNQLINNLRKQKWQNLESMGLDEMINLTRNNLDNAVKPMIRNVEIRANTNNKTWFDSQLSTLKKETLSMVK